VCREELPLTAHYFHRDVTRPAGKGFQGTCKRCKILARRQFVRDNPEAKRMESRRAQQRNRMAALMHYSDGNPTCSCCGDDHIEFLTLDHINGGAKNQGDSGTQLHRWLKAHGYPVGFRVLCHNCNQSIAYYGYCPHQSA
jgi:hypothetical protein